MAVMFYDLVEAVALLKKMSPAEVPAAMWEASLQLCEFFHIGQVPT